MRNERKTSHTRNGTSKLLSEDDLNTRVIFNLTTRVPKRLSSPENGSSTSILHREMRDHERLQNTHIIVDLSLNNPRT